MKTSENEKKQKSSSGEAKNFVATRVGSFRYVWNGQHPLRLFFPAVLRRPCKTSLKQDKFVRFYLFDEKKFRKTLRFRRLKEKKEYAFFLLKLQVLSTPGRKFLNQQT